MNPPKGYFTEPYAKVKKYRASGEFRAPKMGEYYLSGAQVEVYFAHMDLNGSYWIAVPVRLDTCPTCQGSGKVEPKVIGMVCRFSLTRRGNPA